jgi:hypothetical protein
MKKNKILADNSNTTVITIDNNLKDYSQSKAIQKKLQTANEILKKYGLPKEKTKK